MHKFARVLRYAKCRPCATAGKGGLGEVGFADLSAKEIVENA